MPLTPQQETAVYNRGGSLLVSAAAGSGKTKVLVERLFSYMEQEGCQVDDFLIITYTKAAAAELRGKIAQELTRRVADRPGDSHLRRQMLPGVSGGHQNRGRLLRRTAPRERAPAAPGGGAQPDPGFPGAGRTGGHAAAAAGAGPGIGGFLRPHRGGRQRPPAGGDPGSRTG